MLSFHGGEPFYYVKHLTAILTRVEHLLGKTMVFIQTNGSLVEENGSFFEQFRHLKLIVSISYDFAFQGVNRTSFDLMAALQVLKRHSVKVQLQYVIPLEDATSMSLDVVREIMKYTTASGLVSTVNLIPLRHIRGKDNFRLTLDNVDIPSMFYAMLKFIEVLYIMGVKVTVDGHGEGIHKNYFHDHKQLVLSPDGRVYPEYDFLEYKMTQASIGSWNGEGIILWEVDTSVLVPASCESCSQTNVCGLKYLFKAFDREPRPEKCEEFYKRLTLLTLHAQRINQKKSLAHWVA